MIDSLEKLEGNSNSYILPRGGYLVDSPIGYIQFGSPPETIKDTMKLPDGVPEIFVLTEEMFSWIKGISIGEIEFPLYFNYFIRKKKTLIICRKNQFSKIKKVLQESIFGPKTFDLKNDYISNIDESKIPEIINELNFFRSGNKLSNMVRFGIFEDNKFTYKGITISIDQKKNYSLKFHNEQLATIPGNFEYKATYSIGERLKDPYLPPAFCCHMSWSKSRL